MFLLMGCQTTENTPIDNASPEKVVKKEKPRIPPRELVNPMVVHKPVLCGESDTIVSGIIEIHKEQPVSWFESKEVGAGGADHKVLIMANTDTGTGKGRRTNLGLSVSEKPTVRVLCWDN